MSSGLNQSSFMCDFNENKMNTLVVIVFLFSFILFKVISHINDKTTDEQKSYKMKKAEKYFNKHLQENEEFFMVNY